MSKKIKKSIEISDAKISFLSLVDKAANGWEWVIAKDNKSKPGFKLQAPILKFEDSQEKHYITGVVYEPLVGDAHDNYMTAEEIKKAADWFNTNGQGADLQHNYSVQEGITITKSWVVEEDTTINGTVVKAGTWLAEAEVTDSNLWEKIEKGEITGWSMGGEGNYSTVDVDLETIEKSITQKIFSQIGKALGFTWDGKPIADTSFQEELDKKNKSSKFWNAWSVLETILVPYADNWSWNTVFQNDKDLITQSLKDFSEAIQEALASDDIEKALEPSKAIIEKAGKKMSGANKATLDNIVESINNFKNNFEDNEEDEEVKPEDIQKVADLVLKGMQQNPNPTPSAATDPVPVEKSLEEKIAEAVAKAMEPIVKAEETPEETIEDKIAKAVEKAMEPIYKARGISKALDNEDDEEDEDDNEPVNKSVYKGIFGNTGI
jgi:hypothetical protein